MATPIIILGAGASHDYQRSGGRDGTPLRPPLTKDLVDHSYLRHDLSNRYHGASDLLSEVMSDVENGISFEKSLLDIKTKHGNKEHRVEQFIALQFYLRDLFKDISGTYTTYNNYRQLISTIQDYDQGACVVSFNYDTFFEQSMGADVWKSIDSYIKYPISLIKPHGSHDWIYIVDLDREKIRRLGIKAAFDYFVRYPNYIRDIRKQNAHPYYETELTSEGEIYGEIPAIAVPLPDKQEFVCPASHVNYLIDKMSEAKKILIIGWKGGDPHLLELMKEHLRKGVEITIVSSDIKGASEVKKNIENYLKDAQYKLSEQAGFGNFMSSREFEAFFS